MNLSKAHSELDRLFDIFNEKLFENKLEKPIIIIQSTGKKPIYGYCSLERRWSSKDSEQECYELGISAENLARDKEGICGTLIHEMVHLMNVGLGVKDTASNYVYHNKRFKEAAEAVGLIIQKAPRIGWSVTTLGEKLTELVQSLNIDIDAFSFFRKQSFKIKVENKNKMYRYACSCGQVVHSKEQPRIRCVDCGTSFYQLEKGQRV